MEGAEQARWGLERGAGRGRGTGRSTEFGRGIQSRGMRALGKGWNGGWARAQGGKEG